MANDPLSSFILTLSSVAFASFGTETFSSNLSNFSIPGTLVAPVYLTPRPPVRTPNVYTVGCKNASANPRWDLSHVKLVMDTGSWNSLAPPTWYNGVLTFMLRNHANSLTVACAVTSEDLNDMSLVPNIQRPTPTTDRRYSCEAGDHHRLPIGDPHTQPLTGKYSITTYVQYDMARARFSVDQTWFCADEGEDHPVQIRSTGFGPLNLTCTTDASLSTMGFLQQTCLPLSNDPINIDTPISPPVITPLAPYALSTSEPGGKSCTIASILSTAWSTQSWSIYRQLGSTGLPLSDVSVDFNLFNHGFGQTLRVQTSGPSLAPGNLAWDPNRWYRCYDLVNEHGIRYDRELPGSIDCSWQLDLSTGYLAVNQSWSCSDKNRDRP